MPLASEPLRTLTPALARWLFVTKQRLAGPRPPPDTAGIMDLARSLRYLQLDPINVVARSHLLVLWSRLGPFDPADLDRLLWEERWLFEYWAHAASIVLTEDYPIHNLLMRRYPRDRYTHGRKTKAWVDQNQSLRRHVMARIRRDGPIRARDLEDRSHVAWTSSGWTTERNVERMLDYLWTKGRIVVAGRASGGKLWDLAERWFPARTPKETLPEARVSRLAAELSLRALGVARPSDIDRHFTVGRYGDLAGTLARLERAGLVERVRIAGRREERGWPGTWYVHTDDLPLIERLSEDEWEPRTTLLSPFDNLIIDRARTELFFGFNFRMEIYVPKSNRRFGYYVLPILHADRLIGRVDPTMDRQRGRLVINAVHAEPDAPASLATARALARAVEDLARFLGAGEIDYGTVPDAWRRALR